VGEHGFARRVADGEDVLDLRASPVVGRDEAVLVGLDARVLQDVLPRSLARADREPLPAERLDGVLVALDDEHLLAAVLESPRECSSHAAATDDDRAHRNHVQRLGDVTG